MGEVIRLDDYRRSKDKLTDDSETEALAQIYVRLTDPDLSEDKIVELEDQADYLELRLPPKEIEVARHHSTVIINSKNSPEAS